MRSIAATYGHLLIESDFARVEVLGLTGLWAN